MYTITNLWRVEVSYWFTDGFLSKIWASLACEVKNIILCQVRLNPVDYTEMKFQKTQTTENFSLGKGPLADIKIDPDDDVG